MSTSITAAQHAEARDAHQIIPLIHELAQFEGMADVCAPDPEKLHSLLEQKHVYAEILKQISANVPSTIHGYALYYPHRFSSFSTTMSVYLEDLYVQPDYQGHGYARQLLGSLAAQCPGADALHFEVLDWNTKAIAFYQKLGAYEYDVPQTKNGRVWIQMSFAKPAFESLRQFAI